MIDVLQEVTDWGEHAIPNGIYHVNGAGTLVAHQAPGGELVRFAVPIKNFSKTRRKFKKLEQYSEEVSSDVTVVKGSNGKEYYVSDGKCSCPGFTFRGKCKHINT